MRSNVTEYELIAPGTLKNVLQTLAEKPGEYTPVAGGTEIMVMLGVGRLQPKKLVSLWGVKELRFITATDDTLTIGAGATFTDIRRNKLIAEEFPLMTQSASWTGSIANQNRATLGGNIVNASPAADSLPALLVYEAELILASVRGERRVAYGDFHTGYKKMALAPDELIRTIVLPRRYRDWLSSARKVGPRNAQAISKLCMAGLAKVSGAQINEVRVAFGSMAAVPLRLRGVEEFLRNATLNEAEIAKARRLLAAEVSPIDDIRSTCSYRIAVACNLLEEFLRGLITDNQPVLARWNLLRSSDAEKEILSCCGSRAWAHAMTEARPFARADEVFSYATEVWRELGRGDWIDAFQSHPRIGERHAELATGEASARWSAGEQSRVSQSDDAIKAEIAEGNRRYEERFGRIFIIRATGKAPKEILDALERRLANNDEDELRESAAQQEEIMQLRLRKWLEPGVPK